MMATQQVKRGEAGRLIIPPELETLIRELLQSNPALPWDGALPLIVANVLEKEARAAVTNPTARTRTLLRRSGSQAKERDQHMMLTNRTMKGRKPQSRVVACPTRCSG